MWATGTKHGKEYLLLLCLPMYIVLHVSVVATPHQTPTRNFSWTNSQLIFESFQSLIVASPPFPRCQRYISSINNPAMLLGVHLPCWLLLQLTPQLNCVVATPHQTPTHNFSWTTLLNYISPDWLLNPSDLRLVHLIPTSLIPPRPPMLDVHLPCWLLLWIHICVILYRMFFMPFPSH